MAKTLFTNPESHEKSWVRLADLMDGTFSLHARGVVYYTASGSATGGSVSCSGSVPLGSVYRLSRVTMHLSGSSTAVNAITSVTTLSGSAFDTPLSTVAMSGLSDYAYIPTNDLLFRGGDTVVFTYFNANKRTHGIEVVFEPVG